MVDPAEVEAAKKVLVKEDADILEILIDRHLRKGNYSYYVPNDFSAAVVNTTIQRYESKWTVVKDTGHFAYSCLLIFKAKQKSLKNE